jgi:flavin reductase (DIM6/NTAB) family NADH-FMN oxidoreductase RutF
MSATLDEQLAAQTKRALRRLASGVAVVSCRDQLVRQAMTATAINAMSMQPPSMIVCVNRGAGFHAAISSAGRFASGEDRFGSAAWRDESGAPVLIDAQAHVVCANEARLDYGSHTIFVGRVMFVGIHGEIDPLIYVDGKYTCLPPDAVPASVLQTEIELMRQLAM